MLRMIIETIKEIIRSGLKKMYFVDNKDRCWLRRHIKKKRKDSKNKFKKWVFWGFDKWVSQYIMEYEGVDYEIYDDIKKIDETA